MILSYQAHFYGQITIWRILSIYKLYFNTANLKITFSTDCPSQIVIDTSPRSDLIIV